MLLILCLFLIQFSGSDIVQSALSSKDARDETAKQEIDNVHRRFQKYIDIVCSKCLRRDVECGCELGDKNPPFVMLRSYALNYMEWKEQIKNYEFQNNRLLIVDTYDSGLGNQLLNVVNGFIIALVTNRVLIIKRTTGANHNYIQFDSVLPFMSNNYVIKHGIRPNITRELDLWTQPGVDFMMCQDWHDALANQSAVFLKHGVQDVHLAHTNPHHGAQLLQTFMGLDFFFLSHFLWTGEQELQQEVRAATLPEPMPWDGDRRLADLVSDIRATRPLRVVGIHVRISTVLFEFVDTYHYPPGWEDSCGRDAAADGGGEVAAANALAGSDDFCYESSLDSALVCLLERLYGCLPADCRRRARHPPDLGPWWAEGVSGGGDGGGVVLLWATDNDELSAPLLREVAGVPGVRVVRLRPGLAVRSDAHPSTALADAALLGEADELIASAGSTFAHAVHARALVAPHLLAFGDPCLGPGRACAAAAGPEAGLVNRGPMHDVCTLVEWDGWHMGVQCRERRGDCVSVLMDPGWTGDVGGTIGCLQGAASCHPPADPDGGSVWARLRRYEAGVDHDVLFQHVWAKRSRVIIADDYDHLYLPPCPYPHKQNPQTLARFRAAHNGSALSPVL